MKYIVYLKLSFLILANMSLEPTNKYAVDFTSWVHNIWLNLTWPWLVLDPSFKFYWVFTLHKHLGFPNFFVLLIFLVFWVEFVLCFVPDVASVSGCQYLIGPLVLSKQLFHCMHFEYYICIFIIKNFTQKLLLFLYP